MSMIYHYTTLDKFLDMWHIPDDTEFCKIHETKDVDWDYYLTFCANDVRKMNVYKENMMIYRILQNSEHMNSSFALATILGKVYAISFCKQKDYLPMWNLCTQNDSEIGICLGFDREDFEERVEKVNSSTFTGLKLQDCEYLTEFELSNKMAIQKLNFHNSLKKEANSEELQKILQQIMVQLALYRLKDFMYEKETRLIGYKSEEHLAYNGQYDINECGKIKIPLSLLKEIIISPYTKNEDITKIGLEWFLMEPNKMERYDIGIHVNISNLELRY